MRRCKPCGVEKELTSENFYRDKNKSRGYEYTCKDCRKKRDKEKPKRDSSGYYERYVKGNPSKVREYVERNRKHQEKYREEYKLSSRCRSAVYMAIKKGILMRPDECEWCGKSKKRIEAAHYDYSKPLDVKWLCSSCHKKWDHQDPKLIKKKM